MLGRRVEKLTSILEVAKAMIAERDLDALLRIIVDEAAEVVDADRCSLFLVDRDRGVIWSKIAPAAWPPSTTSSSTSSSVNVPSSLLSACSTPTTSPRVLRMGTQRSARVR